MSNYDPFRLYDYKQKKSHKGQVLRKKYVGYPLPTVLTPEQLKEAKTILEGIGYTVTKNPIIPGPTNETNVRSFIYCDEINNNYTFTEGNHVLHLSDVWNSKILDFQDLFVPSDRVNSFNFEINVISYQLDRLSCNVDGTSNVTLRLYNAVDYKAIDFKPSSWIMRGGISYFAENTNNVVLSGGFNNTADDSYDFAVSGVLTRPYTSPFLYHYFDNTLETYNSIVTSDFTNFDPILMQIEFVVPETLTGTTATVNSLYVTYQITMTINTNI